MSSFPLEIRRTVCPRVDCRGWLIQGEVGVVPRQVERLREFGGYHFRGHRNIDSLMACQFLKFLLHYKDIDPPLLHIYEKW